LCVHTQVSRTYASVTAKITPSPHKGTTSFPAMAELVKPLPGSKLVERHWWLVLYERSPSSRVVLRSEVRREEAEWTTTFPRASSGCTNDAPASGQRLDESRHHR
jgi:hypothetical protein